VPTDATGVVRDAGFFIGMVNDLEPGGDVEAEPRRLGRGLFCFGQDLFGTQFAVRSGAQVVLFDPETAQVEALGASLQDWASWLLEDPDVRGAAGFARAFQDAEGPLQPDQRLVPLQPFVGGGDYGFENLSVKDAAVAMRIRGPVAQQLRDLPVGSTIRLRP